MTNERNNAIRSLAEQATPNEAAPLRASLTWHEDQIITNHEGMRVWLKPCYSESGKRIGITDCCFADAPCDRHAALTPPAKEPADAE
jgi:hypothetical protein